MNHRDPHPDNDAIALLARALMPIFAAALAHSANEAVPTETAGVDRDGSVELPRAA